MCTKCYCVPRWELPTTQDRAAGLKNYYWNPGQEITIGFLEGTVEQQEFVKTTAEEWLKYINLKFTYIADVTKAMVRIAFNENDGAWSYLGTQCLKIAKTEPTMNFGWLDKQVVLHEYSHMIGGIHEHQNPRKPIQWNKEVVYKALAGSPNYWDKATVDHNIFRLYSLEETGGTDFDNKSILAYSFPSSWTLDGTSIGMNKELSPTDIAYWSSVYPKNITTDVEEPPKVDYSEYVAKIFNTRKALTDLNKTNLIRVATFCNVTFQGSWTKNKILDALTKKLGIS